MGEKQAYIRVGGLKCTLFTGQTEDNPNLWQAIRKLFI